jgi:PAS domain S-box-containing protein
VASKGNVFRDAVGNPVRMAGVDIDITARKRVEEQLRLLESVVVNAKDAILITEAEPIDQPGPRIVYANAAFTRVTGYTYEEVLGRSPRFLQGSNSDRATLDKIRAALKCWEPVCVELINYRKDSSQFWVEINLVPVKDRIGCYTHWIAIQRDITERKQAEAEHQQLLAAEQAARAASEAANRTKDEFLAIVSHELRSPLNVMLGWARLLRTRKFDQAKTANGLEIIERNARLQTELIEDLLDISRIIRGKLHLNFSKVNLISVIQAAMDVVRSTAESKNIQLNFSLNSEEGEAKEMGRMSDSQAISAPHRPSTLSPYQAKTSSLLVSGDPVRLQQIIWNLLSNAVKFTPEGGRVSVEMSALSDRWSVEGKQQTTDRYAQITVSDTGKGISPEFLPYVFERFRQADSSITRSQAGLGLGLAIVRSLVELHNGTVSAESPGEGQGSTFTIKLPLLEHSNPAEVEGSRGEGNYEPPAPSLDGFQLLVVDDEADAREFVTTVLEQYGAKVIAVASVSEALEAVERSQPDVLVSDIGMPGENGYSLIRKLRQLEAERGGRIPAIALTAYARSEDRAAAIAAGFQLHISKPVDPAQLAAVVANIVKRK